MRRILIAISGLSILGWYVNTFPPESFLHISIFFIILMVIVYNASLSMLKIVRRAVLVTLGLTVWLLLRYLGLREFWYVLLLIPILISLEILYQKR